MYLGEALGVDIWGKPIKFMNSDIQTSPPILEVFNHYVSKETSCTFLPFLFFWDSSNA